MTLADGALDMKARGADAFGLSIMILGVTGWPGCIERCRPGVALAEMELLTPVTVGAATAGSCVLDGLERRGEEGRGSGLRMGVWIRLGGGGSGSGWSSHSYYAPRGAERRVG